MGPASTSLAPTPSSAARCVLALALLQLAGGGLAAQERPDTVAIDTLTVRVLRGATDPRVSPFALSVVGAGDLSRGRSPVFFEDALEAIPGVQVQNRFNFATGERLSVRGFGARAQFGVRGVKVMVDGIPATLPDGQTNLDVVSLPSLGRVEVLRGPGSALHGNAAGGVLLFQTRPPEPGPFRQEARATAGGHGLRTLDLTASGTSGRTGWLVSGGVMGFGGFRTLPADPERSYGKADRAVLNVRVVRPLGGGTLALTALAMDQSGENPGALPPALYDGGSLEAWGNNVRQRTGEGSRQGQLGAQWSGPLGGVATEVAGWLLHRDTDGPIPTSILELSRDAYGARALVRGGGGRWSWDAGGAVEVQGDERRNFVNLEGERGAPTLDQRETVTSLGLFAQARLRAADRLHLHGALRWDRFRFEADDRFTAGGDPDDSGTRVMQALNPAVGAVWDAGPAATLFANVATSLETPTTTELVNRPDGAGGLNPALDPIRGLGAEVGARGTLGAPWRWEVTAFRVWLEDELVPFEVPAAPGRTFFRNAGSSGQRGVEALLELRPLDGVRARLAHTRTIAEFEEYEVDGVDFAGRRIPGLAPSRWEGVLGLERGAGFVELSAEWMAPIPVDDANTVETPAHAVLDLRAGVDLPPWRRLELGVFGGVHNLADARYVTSVVVNAFGSRYFEPGPGRTFHVGVRTGWSAR